MITRLFAPLTIMVLVTTIAAAQTPEPKFSFTVDDHCLGFIIDAATALPVGSGFVLEDKNTVITARHVAIDLNTNQPRKLMYQPPTGIETEKVMAPIPLIPVKNVLAADIAVMRIKGVSPCKRSLKRSKVDVQAGYWIVYGGLDTSTMGFKVSSHVVQKINVEDHKKFLEIEGDARPGYSGGPIFDEVGGILGVVLKGRPTSPFTWLFEAISVAEIPKFPPKKLKKPQPTAKTKS